MVSNEERISRLGGIAEVTQSQLGEIRWEMRALRQDLQAEIRSTRNTTLKVNLVLWMTTIGTLFGLFFGLR